MRALTEKRHQLDGSQVFIKREDGNLGVRTVHSADAFEAVFKANAEERATTHVGRVSGGHTQKHRVRVARIPITYYYHLMNTIGTPDTVEKADKWKAMLNDSEMEKFRTAGGVI